MGIETYLGLKKKIILVGGDHHAHETAVSTHAYLIGQSVEARLVKYDSTCDDYISQTELVAIAVSSEPEKYAGIVGCKNGFGTNLVSNRYPFVFSARCDTIEQAERSRKVNYCNVLAFGSDNVNADEFNKIVTAWLNTDFDIDEKNKGRLARLLLIDRELKR